MRNKVLVLSLAYFFSLLAPLLAQQPQFQPGTAGTTGSNTNRINAAWTNGTTFGYWPTGGTGLTLNLSAGTAQDSTTYYPYAGGSLTMADNATNYVFLDSASSYAPGSNTTGFTATLSKLAKVTTSGGVITAIVDLRGAPTVSSGSGTVTSVATTSPITGGAITTTGTIACATCAIGPGSSSANHLAKFSGTDGITLADGGAIPSGTLTSVATTGPITGGTITSTGTIACPTCVTSGASLTSGQLLKGAGGQGSQVGDLTGDVSTSGTMTTVLNNIPDLTTQAGSILVTDITAPSSPAASHLKLFGDSTDLRLHDMNAAGAVGTTVVADAGATNNFLTAISAAGVISKARPTCNNLSDSSGGCTMSTTAAGDLSGTLPSPTVAKVNGVSYPASPSSHQVPIVTATNTVTYKTIPDCVDTGGNHLNYTQSTDALSCGTSGGGGSGISGLTANYIPKAGTATTITANSAMDDGVTTASTITSSEDLAVAVPASGSAASPSLIATNSVSGTNHRWKWNNQGIGVSPPNATSTGVFVGSFDNVGKVFFGNDGSIELGTVGGGFIAVNNTASLLFGTGTSSATGPMIFNSSQAYGYRFGGNGTVANAGVALTTTTPNNLYIGDQQWGYNNGWSRISGTAAMAFGTQSGVSEDGYFEVFTAATGDAQSTAPGDANLRFAVCNNGDVNVTNAAAPHCGRLFEVGTTGQFNVDGGGTVATGVNAQNISSTTTATLDMSKGNVQQVTCSGGTGGFAITLATSNLRKGQFLTFIFVQNGTLACTVSAASSMHGMGTVTTTLSGQSIQQFVVSNNGTDLYAVSPMQNTTGGTP